MTEKLRVNFHKDLKMHLACNKYDGLRPFCEYIYFQDGYAYATNFYLLVKNNLDTCSTIENEQKAILDGKLLHRDSYEQILKYDTIEISEEGIQCQKGKDLAFFYFCQDSTIKYPNVEKVLQEYKNARAIPMAQVCLNPRCVDIINKAMHTNGGGILFTFKGENGVVLCEDGSEEPSYCEGIFMPITHEF